MRVRPPRSPLIAGLAALSALLIATLAIATNVATAVLPDWAVIHDGRFMWSTVGVLTALTVCLAFLTARAQESNPLDETEVAFEDPRFTSLSGADLPERFALYDAFNLEDGDGRDDRILSNWSEAPPTLRMLVGATYGSSPVLVDFVKDGPNGYICGPSGSGTSELLRVVVMSLACHYPPSRIRMHLYDGKGGATWNVVERLPHVHCTFGARFGNSVEGVQHDFVSHLRSIGTEKYRQLSARSAVPPPSDEIFDLIIADDIGNSYDFHEELGQFAHLGRSLNCGVILGHQTAGDGLRWQTSPMVRFNIVIGGSAISMHPTLLDLPREQLYTLLGEKSLPGRGILLNSYHDLTALQAATCSSLAPSVNGPYLQDDLTAEIVESIGRIWAAQDRSE